MFQLIKEWFDNRIGLTDIIKSQLTEYRVPPDINIFYTLGFVAMAGFLLQVLTGFFLLVYYIPHPDHAFGSVQTIMMTVPFGWLFRLIHVIGSNLMVAAVFFHMLSVFFMCSYKKPREATWITGSLMLLTTLAFCLSGYLLPWSQLSYWATTIVTTIPTAFPYVGEYISELLRGGKQVAGPTLNRFFALHVSFLPSFLLLFLSIHLFLIRRIGISSPPFGRKERKPWTGFRHESHESGYPFFPHFVMRETSMVMLFLGIIFFVMTFIPTLFLPADANTPADPFKTPAHIKPEWYFLAPYQMLRIIPNKFLGISLQIIITLVFILWPFFDVKEEDNILKRPALLSAFLIVIAGWITLTIWGKYS